MIYSVFTPGRSEEVRRNFLLSSKRLHLHQSKDNLSYQTYQNFRQKLSTRSHILSEEFSLRGIFGQTPPTYSFLFVRGRSGCWVSVIYIIHELSTSTVTSPSPENIFLQFMRKWKKMLSSTMIYFHSLEVFYK